MDEILNTNISLVESKPIWACFCFCYVQLIHRTSNTNVVHIDQSQIRRLKGFQVSAAEQFFTQYIPTYQPMLPNISFENNIPICTNRQTVIKTNNVISSKGILPFLHFSWYGWSVCVYKVWVKAVLFFSVNGKTPFACFPVISPFTIILS